MMIQQNPYRKRCLVIRDHRKQRYVLYYHNVVSIGKQSGKAALLRCALPVEQACVTVPGTFDDPMVQPFENAPIAARTPQYTMYFGINNSRESIISLLIDYKKKCMKSRKKYKTT